MVVKVYISGISGNKEVKKRQQRVLMILDSRNVKYEVVDVAEPDNEQEKDFMQNNSTSLGGTVSDPTPRHALPPQIFSDGAYCGDYDQFDMANEMDEMEKFLKLAPDDTVTSNAELKLGNGDVGDVKAEVNGESRNEDAVVESTVKDEDVVVENGTYASDEKREDGENVPDSSGAVEGEREDE